MNGWTILFDLDDTLVMTHEIEELRQRAIYGQQPWSQVYNKFDETYLVPRTLELISFLKQGIKWNTIEISYDIGIVTSSPRHYAEKLLNYHNFEIPVISAYHDTLKHKPSPDPILNAMEKLGADSSKTIYVGDTEDDVQASILAGCTPFLFDPDLSYFGTSYTKRLVLDGGRLVTDWQDFLEHLGEIHGMLTDEAPSNYDAFFSEYGIKNLEKRKDLEKEGYDIYFRHIYYPNGKRKILSETNSNLDLSISDLLYSSYYENLKQLYERPARIFSEEIIKWLNSDSQLVLISAPSSQEGSHNTGEKMVVNTICEYNANFVNGVDILERHKSVEQYSKYAAHLDSISVTLPSEMKNNKIIIIDNIVTSGGTLKACIDRVKEAGAKSVIGLAIAKTWGRDED